MLRGSWAARPRYHYATDELCVVVSLDGSDSAAEAEDKRQGELYRRVWETLSGALVPLIRDVQSERTADDGIAKDLAPLRPGAQPGGDRPLRLLERAYVSPDRSLDGDTLRPWVTLPGRKETIALYFYGIGPKAERDAPLDQANASVVRGLVKLINRQREQISGRLARVGEGRTQLLAATPNWLIGPAQDGIVAGGPGTTPELVPASAATTGAGPRFRFPVDPRSQGPRKIDLQAIVDRQRLAVEVPDDERRVVVAVLDTCPLAADVKEKVADLDARGHPNRLLAEVAAHVAIDTPRFVPPGYFDGQLRHIEPNYKLIPYDRGDHRIPDHGLFAAGIVRDIAPTARIHLIRVLDDKGIGDLLVLIHALRALPDHPSFQERRLIINLSLTVDLPIRERLSAFWGRPAPGEREEAEEAWELEIHRSLASVFDWLRERGVLVVAAAGNDADDPPVPTRRPEPRLPARYDNVLGVAAVNSDMAPAHFSNRGDFIQFGNGVAVFGGDDLTQGVARDAIIGIFSAERMPFTNKTNDTGWARWSGTSFATPIISAIAANFWTENHATSSEIMRTVTSDFVTGATVGDLACAAVVAEQT